MGYSRGTVGYNLYYIVKEKGVISHNLPFVEPGVAPKTLSFSAKVNEDRFFD